MKEKFKLSEIMNCLPNGLGIFIGAEARKQGKKYCFGQPQLKDGKIIFINNFTEVVEKFGIGNAMFQTLFIDCNK